MTSKVLPSGALAPVGDPPQEINVPTATSTSGSREHLNSGTPTNSERITKIESSLDVLKSFKSASFKDPTFIIAAAAFLVSITTTFYSIIRERHQTIDNLTAQLRTTLNSFGDIALKMTEANVKYKTETAALQDFSNWAGVQNTVLTSQAVHLASELGGNAEATDLLTVANRLKFIGKYKDAQVLLDQALIVADSSTDKVSVDREYGTLLYTEGKRSDGAQKFLQAIEVLESIPGYNANSYFEYEMSFTYYTWASVESIADCKSAIEHVNTATDWAVRAGAADQWKATLSSGKDWLVARCPH